jgi:hypothetical protein
MSNEHVTVATFDNEVDAAMARNYLESGGVRAFLLDDTTVSMDWALSNAVGGIKLQVKASDLGRAEFLLGQLPDNVKENCEPAPSLATAFATPETVEQLNEEDGPENPKDLAVDRLFQVSVFGLLFCPLQVYALWLLLTLPTIEGPMSANRQWKVWVSVVLSVPLFVLLMAVFLCVLKLP